MKKALITLGLLALATTALAGCAHPHNDDRHRHHSDAGHTTMMAPGSGMGMMGHQQHVDHGGMHGSGPMHHDGMDHGDGHHGNGRHDPFAASHERMMEDMHGFELTGDPDYDFVRGMIPHHQGAIDMAQVLLDQGSDPDMLTLARAVIEAQEAEIADMEAWLEAYGEPRPADRAADIRAGYQRTNERMMRDMHIRPSGNVDRDFVVGMIPHHEAAIDMARILLQYSDDPELRSLAEDVIREQEREIREMQDWLNR